MPLTNVPPNCFESVLSSVPEYQVRKMSLSALISPTSKTMDKLHCPRVCWAAASPAHINFVNDVQMEVSN